MGAHLGHHATRQRPDRDFTPLIVRRRDAGIVLHGRDSHCRWHEPLRENFAGCEAGIGIGIRRPEVGIIRPIEGIGKQRGAGGGGRGRGIRGDGRIGAEIAHGIPGSDPVAITGAEGQVGVGVAGRGGSGDQREVGAADPLATLQFVAGDVDVIGRGGPTQADLRPAEHIAHETAWHRWREWYQR